MQIFSIYSTLCYVWKFFVNKGRTKFFHTFIKHFHSITTHQKSEVYVWWNKPSAVWNTLKCVILNPFNFSFHVKFSGEKIVQSTYHKMKKPQQRIIIFQISIWNILNCLAGSFHQALTSHFWKSVVTGGEIKWDLEVVPMYYVIVMYYICHGGWAPVAWYTY